MPIKRARDPPDAQSHPESRRTGEGERPWGGPPSQADTDSKYTGRTPADVTAAALREADRGESQHQTTAVEATIRERDVHHRRACQPKKQPRQVAGKHTARSRDNRTQQEAVQDPEAHLHKLQ